MTDRVRLQALAGGVLRIVAGTMFACHGAQKILGVLTTPARQPAVGSQLWIGGVLEFFGRGGALKSSWYGDCLPSRDFPMLVDLHLDGRLPLEKFVSETIGLGDVEAAFTKMEHGDVLRSVVVF